MWWSKGDFPEKKNGENATKNAIVKLNKTQKRILSILDRNKLATYDDIAQQLSVERTTVWRNIKIFQEKGYLLRIGGKNGGYWETKKD